VAKFEVKQSDLTVEGRFQKPAFGVVGAGQQKLHESLLSRLATFGSAPSNVFLNAATGSLADRGATFNIPSVNAGIKLSIDKVEIGFNDLTRVHFPQLRTIATHAFEALDEHVPDLRYVAYIALLNYHGLIEGVKPLEFIGQYVTKAPDLGMHSGSAAGFYYGPKGSRHQLNVIVDTSVAVPNGVYIRIAITFDGSKLAHDTLTAVAAKGVKDVFTAFQLETTLDFGDADRV
jgi:hypothetical protein